MNAQLARWTPAWQQAWRGTGAAGDGADVRAALLSCYAEPHRAYHTTHHLAECLAALDLVRPLAPHPAEVELALWFHDAVYDAHRHDNEEQSAGWARSALEAAGALPDAAGRVAELVLATKHATPPAGPDAALLVDIDLGILGADAARFDEYERQVRTEYAFVPDEPFRLRRRGILQGFLARPAIYATEHFAQRLEARARRNLARSIARIDTATGAEPP